MLALLLTFGLALVCSVFATMWARSMGHKLGIVDRPDGVRRMHTRVTPRVGGVGVFLGAGLAILIPAAAGLGVDWFTADLPSGLVPLGLGALAMFVLGLVDDVRDLRALTKFAIEALVAVGLYWAGLRVGNVSLGDSNLVTLPAALDLTLTVFWFVGMANAFNLIDGHDGVAGGVALLALATISFAAVQNGNTLVAVPALAMSGAVLGFLLFNLPPASVFLGDAGSLFIGYALAGLGLVAVRVGDGGSVPVLVPTLALGLPVLDTSLAIFRRFLRGDPVFSADRGHIHHRLRDMGYPKTAVTLFMWGLAAIFSLVAVMLLTRDPILTAVGLTLAVTVSLLAVRWLETPEIMELGQAIYRGFVQRKAIAHNVRLRSAVELLASAGDAEALDDALKHAFEDSHSDHIELWVPGEWEAALTVHPGFQKESFGVSWKRGQEDAPHLWEITVALDLSAEKVGRLSLHYQRPRPDALAHVDSIVQRLRPALCLALDRVRTAPLREAETGEKASADDDGSDRERGRAPN